MSLPVQVVKSFLIAIPTSSCDSNRVIENELRYNLNESLTPAVLLALLRPRTAARTVIAGMCAGLATALLWKLLGWRGWLSQPWDELKAVIPALVANVAAMLVADLVRRARTVS